jgi:hypothetical protein
MNMSSRWNTQGRSEHLQRFERVLPVLPDRRNAKAGSGLLVTVGVILLAVLGVVSGIDAGLFSIAPQTRQARSRMLTDTLDHLSAKSYEEVAAMQGAGARPPQGGFDPRYRIDVAVSQASLGILEIQAVLVDRELGRQVDRLVTYRSKERSPAR